MTKATVTRLFIGSLIAAGAGAVAAIIAVWLGIENGVFVMNGSDVSGINPGLLSWALMALGFVGGLTFAGGLTGGLVSWIGALLNTSQHERKTWFLALLVLGIFNFGFFAMIAYVIAGPDGMSPVASRRAQVPASA